MKFTKYESIIESILFVSGEAISVEAISDAIDQDIKTTKLILRKLADLYEAEDRGIQILEIGNSYQMCTNKNNFEHIKKVYEIPVKNVLTQALLETLAIITYKQPITKNQIEEIRGVNADHAVNKLMEYGLIVECGRMNSPGKPILFATSEEFLKHFGFKNLNELPQLKADHELITQEEIDNSISFIKQN